ncbi:MAG: septum formation protein Maf [Deltaproteobacteria bacterium]|nr:septum formation protein Maf [Deltaproteobacteria bacterium]
MHDLVLASASPRRREMLSRLGLRFRVVAGDIAEVPRPGEAAEAFALRAAREKAAAVRAREPAALVLAADTVVVLDGAILGKPRDLAEARSMVGSLSGRTHVVSTGTCLRGPAGARERVVSTRVTMKTIRPWELEAYLALGEWADKAGGYGIQEGAAHLVSAVEGSYTNVVGLPLCEVVEDLIVLGVLSEGARPV